MNKEGVIYVMTTVIPGVVKIGKTRTDQYEVRMNFLESNGYRNVAGLKREFAIEVEDYDQKEELLHRIFEKSRLSDTELFAVNLNTLLSLLTSFEGKQIYPKDETKSQIFDMAVDIGEGDLIPDGEYLLRRKIKLENNKEVIAKAKIVNGNWTLLKGSIFVMKEGKGCTEKVREKRKSMPIDMNTGKLLEDVLLGECSPSFSGALVINASIDGWTSWVNEKGKYIDIYRKHSEIDE